MSFLSFEDFENARRVIAQNAELWKRTPLICHWKDLRSCAAVSQQCDLYLKMENTQVTGSYKVRGIINQLHHLDVELGGNPKEKELVTISAGNFGKAFAFLSGAYKSRYVVMAETAPPNRKPIIEGFGAVAERVPVAELDARVEYHVSNGRIFVNPLNDVNLIIGHGCIGMEILDDLRDPDVIVVPCGGGSLLGGIAASVRLSGRTECRIYGVEPENACTMSKSLQAGKALRIPASSIAVGLSTPYVGEKAFQVCQAFVEEILVVPEAAIIRSVKDLYEQGFVVEASGAVAYAAISLGLVPNTVGKKVVVILTGGNISPQEMLKLSSLE